MKRITNKGFTLIELLIVIIILAILAGLLITRFRLYSELGKFAEFNSTRGQLGTAEAAYSVLHSSFTDQWEDLDLDLPAQYVSGDVYEGKHFTFTLALTADGYSLTALRGDRITDQFSNYYGQYTVTYDYPDEPEITGCAAPGGDAECEEDLLLRSQ